MRLMAVHVSKAPRLTKGEVWERGHDEGQEVGLGPQTPRLWGRERLMTPDTAGPPCPLAGVWVQQETTRPDNWEYSRKLKGKLSYEKRFLLL